MTTKPATRRSGRLQLRYLLVVLFVVLALVPTLIVMSFTTNAAIQRERERATRQLTTLADLYEQALNFEVASIYTDLTEVATDPDLTSASALLLKAEGTSGDPQTYTEARARFYNNTASQVRLNPNYAFFTLVTTSGKVVAASDVTLINRDISSEMWYQTARQIVQPSIQIAGPSYDSTLGRTLLYFTYPINDQAGTSGYVILGVDVLLLKDAMAALPVLGQTGDLYLLREGQQYVVSPRTDRYAAFAQDEIAPVALSGAGGSGTWVDNSGDVVIGIYRWINALDMALVAQQDEEEALAGIGDLARANAIIAVLSSVFVAALGLLIARWTTGSLTQLSNFARRIAGGELAVAAPTSPFVELDQVAGAMDHMTSRLRNQLETQEQVIEARTRDLRITAEIGRVIAAETDLQQLLEMTVTLIRDRLGYYHAQVFLLDDVRQNAVLRASTGEAGQALLGRRHKLAIGSHSAVGQAAQRGLPVLASDTSKAEFWAPNPLLPHTRAELAVPLRLADTVIGVLDVQSTEPETFDSSTIATIETIADQLTVALRNAQLFQEKERLLETSNDLIQTFTRDSWSSYLAGLDQNTGYLYDLSDVSPLDEDLPEGHNGHDIALPIALRGEVIGELAAALPEGNALSDEQRQVVSKVLDRVAVALENARLFEQTQLSLMETNRLYTASQRLAEAETVQELATSLMQIAHVEGVDQVTLLMLDDPEEAGQDRRLRVAGTYIAEGRPALLRLPERTRSGQPPLLGIEDVPPSGEIYSDLNTADVLPEASRTMLTSMGVASLGVFPLTAGRRTIAWLLLASASSQAVDERTALYLEAVADQAATALESVRLLEQTQMRARRLQHSNEVSRAASSILNPDILLPLVVDQISQAFDYYHVQVFLVDEMARWAELRASTGDVGRELLRRKHRLEVGSQSVIGQVTALGEPVVARDTDTDPVHRRNELLPNTRAEMAIPLKTGDRIIGALDVQSTEPNAFDTEAQAILQSLADQLAVTLENAQLFQEIQERVAELTTVNLVSQAVSRAETLDELYDVVTTQLMRAFGAQYGYLGVLDDTKTMINLPIFIEDGARMESPAPLPLGDGISSYVIRTREVLLLNENVEEEAAQLGARIVGSVTKSVLAVPLLIGDEAIGVISIQDRENELAYDESHIRQLSTLAAYIAVKIRNAELLEQAQQRADELSFLFVLTRAALASTDLNEALSNVAEIVATGIRSAESTVVYLADLPGLLVPHAAVGYGRAALAGGREIAFGEGHIGQSAQSKQPQIINDLRKEGYPVDASSRTRSALLVPLQARGETVGVLAVESTQPAAFTQSDLSVLETASGTLTAIVENARLLVEINQAYENLQELDKLKSQFLANMSHELRTPLNSIIGFSRVMLKGIDGPLTDLQKQDLNTIYNSGTHLLNLINEILDMSKIEAGKMELQREPVNIAAIIDDVTRTAEGLLQDKPIEMYVELEPELPEVMADPVRIRQVLLNLVSNAVKFTQEGSISIRAQYYEHHMLHDTAAIQVDVSDTGIGIADEDMSKLFEAFRQVDGSTTRQVGGTGLGLPIAREFVELHGGRMWVTSELEVGSTFSFTIPLQAASAPFKPSAPSTLQMPVAQRKVHAYSEASPADVQPARRIIAVDDEPGVLELYERYLTKQGYEVVTRERADTLLQDVRELSPHAIVLDLNLPGVNGWDALAELKRMDDTRNIPVIICSIDDDRPRAHQLGAAGYLVKPITEDDLASMLAGVLAHNGHGPVHDVLVVDPDEEFAAPLIAALQGAGDFTLRHVLAGYECLGEIQEQRPDLVIMDFDLPDMDGLGLLAAMRSHPVTSGIPVIVLTTRQIEPTQLDQFDMAEIALLDKREYAGDNLLENLPTLLGILKGTA